MENMYVYKVEGCLKRFLAYDNKGAGYLLNGIHVFNSETGKVIFSASRTDIYNGSDAKHNFDEKKQIDFGDITRRVKLNLTKKGHFIIKTSKKDSWEDRSQYELYLDDAILKGTKDIIVTDETLRTTQRDIYYFELAGKEYHMQSTYTSQDKPLDVLKGHKIKMLQYVMDKVNEATTKEEMDKVLDMHCSNLYVSDRYLNNEVN